MHNFRNLNVYKDSIELVKEVYSLVNKFPVEERYMLANQMCRSSISIPSNIAEGSSRTSDKDLKRFIEIAMGSAFELETQLTIAFDLGYVQEKDFKTAMELTERVEKRLNAFHKAVKSRIWYV